MSISGDILTTSGMFSTAKGHHDSCGDIMSTSGGVQYIE